MAALMDVLGSAPALVQILVWVFMLQQVCVLLSAIVSWL